MSWSFFYIQNNKHDCKYIDNVKKIHKFKVSVAILFEEISCLISLKYKEN